VALSGPPGSRFHRLPRRPAQIVEPFAGVEHPAASGVVVLDDRFVD